MAILTLVTVTGCGGSQKASEQAGQIQSQTANASGGGKAAGYPEKPIRLLITHGAGGITDIVARGIAPYLEKELGVPVVPENMVGSGGRVARAYVFKAEPDGYTILATGMPSLQLGELLYNGQYKSKEFTPIANIQGFDSGLIYVAKDSPIQSLDDLKALAQKRKITVATGGGLGSTDHVLSVMLKKTVGLPHTLVPFDGDSEAAAAVLGHNVDAAFSSAASVDRMKNQIRVLAVYSEKRLSTLPDAPTLKELGYEGLVMESEIGLVAPPGLPAEKAQVLQSAMQKVLSTPEVQQWAEKVGIQLKPLIGEEYGKEIARVYDLINQYLPDLKADVAQGGQK